MGNFAILRVQKVKTMSSFAARSRHNFREQDTPNADENRLGLNAIEGAKNTDELLKAVSNLLPQKRRKDAVIGLEYLITASPEHFGEDWQKTKNFGMDYFSDAIEWLEKKHGKSNVVCKTVHLDESTPHLAAFVVPLVNGKLNAKSFTGGAKVLAEMQTDFAEKVGLKHGLERGVERSKAVHQDNAKIKAMTAERLALRKQVKALAAEVERLTKATVGGGAALAAAQDALAKMEARAKHSQETLVKFNKQLTEIEKKLKNETEEKNAAQDMFKVASAALATSKQGLAQAVNHEELITAEYAARIEKLIEEKKAMAKELQTASTRDHQLVAQITDLRKTNANAAATVEQLQAVNRVLVDQARARLAVDASKALEVVTVEQPPHSDQEAFLERHKALPIATKGELDNGSVVEHSGLAAVISLGRGNTALHTFSDTKELKLHLGKGKGQGQVR